MSQSLSFLIFRFWFLVSRFCPSQFLSYLRRHPDKNACSASPLPGAQYRRTLDLAMLHGGNYRIGLLEREHGD